MSCYMFVVLVFAVGAGVSSTAAPDRLASAYPGPFFEDSTQILTDPMLTGPSADGVIVVWYSELPDARHEVVYGEALDRRVQAQTSVMSQLFEDSDSRINGRAAPIPAPGDAIAARAVFRHAAQVVGLQADRRVPYYAVTHSGGETFRSRIFTLQPLPSPDRPVKLLPRQADLWLGVEKELLDAGVELVHSGHSHIWNRSFVDRKTVGHRLHYLETSNVGNSFGPTANLDPRAPWVRKFFSDATTNRTRDKAFWPADDYKRFGDPHGRANVPPSRTAQGVDVMKDEGGPEHLPFISSNLFTVFSILDSAEGTVRSYAHDTRLPDAPAFEVDCFSLAATSEPAPCSLPSITGKVNDENDR